VVWEYEWLNVDTFECRSNEHEPRTRLIPWLRRSRRLAGSLESINSIWCAFSRQLQIQSHNRYSTPSIGYERSVLPGDKSPQESTWLLSSPLQESSRQGQTYAWSLALQQLSLGTLGTLAAPIRFVSHMESAGQLRTRRLGVRISQAAHNNPGTTARIAIESGSVGGKGLPVSSRVFKRERMRAQPPEQNA
jgi:hypothetical protein